MSDIDALRQLLQQMVDAADDGERWTVGHQVVVVMSLERIVDGNVEGTSWYWTPAGQADWMTDGLLEAVIDMRAAAEVDD